MDLLFSLEVGEVKCRMINQKVLTIHISGLLSKLVGCLVKKLLNLKALMSF